MALEALYTKKEVAKALKVHPKTLDRWIAKGKISPGHKINERNLRWFESELQLFLAQMRMGQFAKDKD